MSSNKKLGKGLSSLLGNKAFSASENTNNKNLLLVPIEQIFRDENQPRKEFDKEKLNELSQSIIKNGLIQPLIIRVKDEGVGYIIVAGERRWRASQQANLKTIPCLMLPADLDQDEVSLIENIQREDLKISEEAAAYQRLIEKNDYTHDQLSKIVGKSRSHITNLLRILSLDKYFFNLLNSGIISMGHARALIGKVPNDFDQQTLDRIANGKISVRDLESGKSYSKKTDVNTIQEERYLSSALGFKTTISHNKNGKGNIKIFYENIEQYNFIVNKLKN